MGQASHLEKEKQEDFLNFALPIQWLKLKLVKVLMRILFPLAKISLLGLLQLIAVKLLLLFLLYYLLLFQGVFLFLSLFAL